MTCRDEILDCFRALRSFGHHEVAISEVVAWMRQRGSAYEDSTIRTHVSSRMCKDAEQNHQTKYDDLQRVGRGVYRLISSR